MSFINDVWDRVGYTPVAVEMDPERYRSEDGIISFVKDVLGVEKLAPYQEDILRAVVRERRVCARGPHGPGKTAMLAWIVLWAMSVFDTDAKCVTTASAWRQLEKYLWPEIRKWAMRANWSLVGLSVSIGKELLNLSLRITTDTYEKEAFAVASDNAALIEGAHASFILYVFDEAKAIPAAIFDAAEGAFSTGQAYAVAMSTPGEASGRFYDISSRKPGYLDWWTRHITLDEAIAAGRISPEWVEARKRQWGEGTAIYQNRVLGEFADSDEDSVIPLSWAEKAVERWYFYQDHGYLPPQPGFEDDLDLKPTNPGPVTWGLDVARYGADDTVLTKLNGRVLELIEVWPKQGTMETVNSLASLVDPTELVAVDVIGVGAGVFDRLDELEYAVLDVNVSEGTDLTDDTGTKSFVNLRSALWWIAHDALNPDNPAAMALPPNDQLIGDLVTPKWTETTKGKVLVESKDSIRKRLGRSTDYGDSFMLAKYAQIAGMNYGIWA